MQISIVQSVVLYCYVQPAFFEHTSSFLSSLLNNQTVSVERDNQCFLTTYPAEMKSFTLQCILREVNLIKI